MSRLNFQIQGRSPGSAARAGHYQTLHGRVETPLFMPVGTNATVRAQTWKSVEDSGSQVLLANTFHLMQRPGVEVFKKFGGIHKFMNWKGSVLTDSGGFQIFSLAHMLEMKEEGARFKSLIDSSPILLTPEKSIEVQKVIGSDIMMVLDQCIPSTAERGLAIEAMERTHRWARRSLDARGDSLQSIFGIAQGACYPDLRKQSAQALSEMPFDGFAIGGLAVGETRSEREDMCELTASHLPDHLPRYLMGVGTPIDLLEAVHRGVDQFDCILPTAFSQQSLAYTSRGALRLMRSVYKFAEEKLDPGCSCPTCETHSRAYLHHLFKAREVLAWQLVGAHNLYFYHRLMREMRASILAGRFLEFYRETKPRLEAKDEENPVKPTKPKKRKARPALVLGDYEVQVSETGYGSVKQRSSGEVMHSVNDPEEEARVLYVEQSRLLEKLRERPVVLWDVGLGAATNAVAAVRAVERELGIELHKLTIVSFERDLDSLRLALLHPELFSQARHGASHAIASQGRWESKDGRIEWTLLQGDFLERMKEAARPDVVFYDPFSYKTDSPLWSCETFARVREACGTEGTELFTYSASTAVRSALLGAGFYVARGRGTGPKEETTVALTLPEEARLLGKEWLERWERSGAKYPSDLADATELERARFAARIRSHQQFTV